MTDMTADEAVEEILGVPLMPVETDRPVQAEPCWEEKTGSPIDSFDPDDSDGVAEYIVGKLNQIEARLGAIEQAVNSVGTQTNWLVQAFASAQTGFFALSDELASKGPMGLLKMLSSKKKGVENNG